MKKRIIAVLLTVILAISLVSAMSTSASAATKKDLLNIIMNDPDLGQFEHVTTSVVNQIDNFNFTSEQCDYLIQKFYEFKELIFKYGDFVSETAHEYQAMAMEEARVFIADVVEHLGYTCAYIDAKKPLHVGDIVFQVYDAKGNIVFEYDGDFVRHTDEVEQSVDVAVYLIPVGGALIFAAAVYFALKGRKQFAKAQAVGA